MLSDSLGQVLGVFQGSMTGIGGSIGDVLGDGIGNISDILTPLLDGIATASGAE